MIGRSGCILESNERDPGAVQHSRPIISLRHGGGSFDADSIRVYLLLCGTSSRPAFALLCELNQLQFSFPYLICISLKRSFYQDQRSRKTTNNHAQHTSHHEPCLPARRRRVCSERHQLQRPPHRSRKWRAGLQPLERDGGTGDEDRV